MRILSKLLTAILLCTYSTLAQPIRFEKRGFLDFLHTVSNGINSFVSTVGSSIVTPVLDAVVPLVEGVVGIPPPPAPVPPVPVAATDPVPATIPDPALVAASAPPVATATIPDPALVAASAPPVVTPPAPVLQDILPLVPAVKVASAAAAQQVSIDQSKAAQTVTGTGGGSSKPLGAAPQLRDILPLLAPARLSNNNQGINGKRSFLSSLSQEAQSANFRSPGTSIVQP